MRLKNNRADAISTWNGVELAPGVVTTVDQLPANEVEWLSKRGVEVVTDAELI